ncbi:MAG: xanthine dehydrogenase molybdopterin binding subunit [Proteobacteria bacterium]|nr:xanthine dehydrogenase molybdopterin binding subunit [Pseudomonadota bacterium]
MSAAADPPRHDSAHKHVTGQAVYIDDLVEPAGLLHVYFGISAHAHARITRLDLEPVRAAEGVVLVIAAADIPGENDISPTHRHDEPVFAEGLVEYHGQPLFAVAAESRDQARRAALLADVEYAALEPVLTVDAAARTGVMVTEPLTLARGDAAAALEASPHRISGHMVIGGQDHFYLEGQIAMALPGEDGEVTVIASTQHPTEIQHMVAKALGLKSSAVTVEVRRMGGAFGGKETQGNLFAVAAALVATMTGRAAKARPDRDDDMIITGKRHDFRIDYHVGFDDDGLIRAVDMRHAARCGWSADLSGPVTDRALFHADNCYYYPQVRLVSAPLKTNTVSNTAFRGFGGPQGMLGAERLIEEIAFALGRDPLEIRKANLYGGPGRDVTPYHQTVEDNLAPEIIGALERDCDYAARREDIRAHNAASKVLKRGLALTPVKFGISFTLTAFNQAGALVHVYRDGSIQLNHGGTEMGQGLYTKVAQVVAEEFRVSLERVTITATTTGKVPNTSATAASSGSDLNGMAARAAARTIKQRLIVFADLARIYPDAKLVFTGGSGSLNPGALSEADVAQKILIIMGTDMGRIRFEREARNTFESGRKAKALALPNPSENWLLVTSALHMPRAMGVFRKAGWPVTAYPVDYRTGGAGGLRLRLRFNLAGNGNSTQTVIREWVGLAAYKALGRTDDWFPAPEDR